MRRGRARIRSVVNVRICVPQGNEVRDMSKLMIAFLLAALVVSLVGCQTPVRDEEQQVRQYSKMSELNRRMLAEDIDHILLLERPSRLSQWHVRTQ